jgi:ankyrin repeat protein
MMLSTLVATAVLIGGPSLNEKLVEAVRHNDLPRAKLLLRKGANADFKSQDRTPVLLEIFRAPTSYGAKGSIEPMVRLLLSWGAKPKEVDSFGWNALTLAPPDISLSLIKDLIFRGAEPNRVAMHGDPAIIRFAGSRLDVVQLLAESGAKVDQEGYLGQSALGEAAKAGRLDIVRYLLTKGANPKFTGYGRLTPLHWAASSAKDNTQVLDFLVGLGVDVNTPSESGQTPLHWVAIWGSEASAKWLLAHGADKNAKDHKGQTPLKTAIKFQEEAKINRSKMIALLSK